MSNENQKENENEVEDNSRRHFFKLGLGAAAIAGVGVSSAYAANKIEGVSHSDFPVPIDPDVLKPMPQENSIWTFIKSPLLADKFPERNQNFENGWNFQQHGFNPFVGLDNSKPGMRQLDLALMISGWAMDDVLAPGSSSLQIKSGVYGWEQHGLMDQQWQFESAEDASQSIKSAARLLGATRCGITRNHKVWNWDPLYDSKEGREVSWDEFPFVPKTVIVVLIEEDYQAIATAPSYVSGAAVGMGYSQMATVAGSLATFIRGLGYQAVGAGNDLGNSVAYAIEAGLGEGARNGHMMAPRFGPRVRIAKVYTDLELPDEAYDKPKSFGIMEFCEKCKLCAEKCPSKAISLDDKPGWGPTYENGENPEYSWHHQRGVKKFYNDAKKCYKYWVDSGTDCAICMTACPWNKPDFWHHRLIDASNAYTGGPIHTFMKVMDELFGYGNVFDEQAVFDFWKTGKDIEV
ncbi:reductive dehalogenase [Vibrio sp. VB16]|uniref:reductive dehalogenase n=1 Tax=Vibrio sp. VB16 TaxID=2785746 RepID=UPI00189D1FA4|nr:reductive dehalogenase [Vibrio sp. VB16]UGA57166.1 reductive dehalogenase [Vibrio sp. VB16]